MKFGQLIYKRKISVENSTKNVAWKLVPGFFTSKESSVERNLISNIISLFQKFDVPIEVVLNFS